MTVVAVRESATGLDSAPALAFLGPGEPDHLDARSPYTIRSGQLLGLLTRRLFGYRAADDCPDEASAGVPVPDLALAVPSKANGGISEDGRTYRFPLRRGVYWDAQGARELVAGDFIRGFKRIAHPTAAGARRYFTDTILGMREYCQAYDEALGGWQANAPDFAQFQARHEVAGIRALDRHTVEIELIAPANDLLHLLATSVAAAAPREYDYYVPDSHELLRNAPSAGPYRIARGRSRGGTLVLEPNPRWDPHTDPIRRRAVQEIRIGELAGDGVEPDLAWTFGTVSWTATGAPSGQGSVLGWGLGPYLVANLHKPIGGRLVSQQPVREAIDLAIDRVAIRDLLAREGLTASVQHGLLLPGAPGYHAEPLGSAAADLDRARNLLAGSGVSGRPVLTLAVPDTTQNRRVAAALQANLAGCGLELELRMLPADRFADRLGALDWDLALASWAPDWPANNGRTAVEPLVRGGAEPGAANYGGYDNPVLDRLLDQALQAPDRLRADELWRQVEATVRRELPIVPIAAHTCGPCQAAADAAPRLRWFAPAG